LINFLWIKIGLTFWSC